MGKVYLDRQHQRDQAFLDAGEQMGKKAHGEIDFDYGAED